MPLTKDNAIWQDWQNKMNRAKDRRTLWECQVSTVSHFAAGIQRVWWDEEGNFKEKKLLPNEVWRTINLFQPALAIHEARLTANNPRWNAKRSLGMDNVTLEQIKAANAALNAVYETKVRGDLNPKRIFKLAIRRGYLEGGAILYNRFDDELDMPVIDLFSLWDTYADESSEDIYNKGHMGFLVPKGIDWIKDQKEWSKKARKEIVADGLMAESRFKQEFLQRKAGSQASSAQTRLLLYAFDYGSNGLRFRVLSSHGVLFEQNMDEYTNLCDLFTKFSPVDTGDFYTRPPTMDWVDPQKSVNKTFSNIECYIDNFLQGKWMLESENVTVPIAGAHGQKIYASEGAVQQLKMQPLPNTHFLHFERALQEFQRQSGVNDVDFGRFPSGGADSSKAISAIASMSEGTSASPVDNYRRMLQEVGVKILRDLARHWNTQKTVYVKDPVTLTEEAITVMGEDAYNVRDRSRGKAIQLRAFNNLDVELVMGSMFEKQTKQKMLIDLLQVWKPGENSAADQITMPIILDTMNIGVGQEVMDVLRRMQNPDRMIAEGKALKIVDGEKVIVNNNDPHEFLAQFYAARAKEYASNGDLQSASKLNSYASIHNTFVQNGKGTSGNPAAPSNLADMMGQTEQFGGQLPVGG